MHKQHQKILHHVEKAQKTVLVELRNQSLMLEQVNKCLVCTDLLVVLGWNWRPFLLLKWIYDNPKYLPVTRECESYLTAQLLTAVWIEEPAQDLEIQIFNQQFHVGFGFSTTVFQMIPVPISIPSCQVAELSLGHWRPQISLHLLPFFLWVK